MSNGIIDKNEYNAICVRDLEKMDEVQVVQSPLDYASVFIRRSFNLTRLIDQKINSSFSRLWFPFLIKLRFKDNKPICFVFSSYNLPFGYFKYLKKKYPNCKLVKVYRDLVSVITQTNPAYSVENVKNMFDICMSFDKKESDKFEFEYFHEIESKVDVPLSPDYPLSDVFIAAKAKDRLPRIMKAYEIFSQAGLKCDFYLTGVPHELKVNKPGVTYADANMPYMEMLYRSINSRCMLDINQGGAVGFTSRFLEAVMYNKKLIVNNPYVKKSKFYIPEFIQCVDSIEDIDPEFVYKDTASVDYLYHDEFSPVNLIKQIEGLLCHE